MPLVDLGPAPVKKKPFEKWYAEKSKILGLSPDPDDPRHHYDYRAAFRAGAEPDEEGHWPSKYKKATHPKRYVGGVDTITGKKKELVDLGPSPTPIMEAMKAVEPATETYPPPTEFLRTKEVPEVLGELKQPKISAWKPGLKEKVKNAINDMAQRSPFVQPGKRLGQLGLHHLTESISGLGLYIPDVLISKISENDTLVSAVDKITGFEPTPRDTSAGDAAKFVTSLHTVGAALGPAISRIPARAALKTILGAGLTFGTRKTTEEIAKKISVGKPIDVEGIHFESGIGILFGAGEVGIAKFARFISGLRKLPKAQITSARAEVNAALKHYKTTGDRTQWDAVRAKYAGIKPEGLERIKARVASPKVKDFGKHPLARPAVPPPTVGKLAPQRPFQPITKPKAVKPPPEVKERITPISEAITRVEKPKVAVERPAKPEEVETKRIEGLTREQKAKVQLGIKVLQSQRNTTVKMIKAAKEVAPKDIPQLKVDLAKIDRSIKAARDTLAADAQKALAPTPTEAKAEVAKMTKADIVEYLKLKEDFSSMKFNVVSPQMTQLAKLERSLMDAGILKTEETYKAPSDLKEKMISRLEAEVAKVVKPPAITKTERKALQSKGYSVGDILKMDRAEARKLIKAAPIKPKKPGRPLKELGGIPEKPLGLTKAEVEHLGRREQAALRAAQLRGYPVGFKMGAREEIDKARSQINKIRIAQKLTEGNRKQAHDIVKKFIPKEKQYRYTKRILAAKTPKRIEQLTEAIDTYIDREDKRLAVKDFRKFVRGVNKKYRRGETKLGKLRPETTKAIADVLDKFDIVKLSEAKEKDLKSLEGYVKRISGTVADAFESMEEDAINIMQMPNARVRELERLSKVHIGELDADEIRYIQKSLEDLIAVNERKGQIKEARRSEKLRDDVNASVKEIAPRKAVEPTEMIGAVKWVAVHGQSNLDTLSSLASGKQNSSTKKLLDTGLHKGNKKKAGKLKEFVLYTRGKLKDIGFTTKDLGNLEKLEKITIGGKTFYAHRNSIVSIYAHTQAEGNLRRLLKTQGLNFTTYRRHPKYGFLKAKHTIRTGKPTLTEIKKVISKVTEKEKSLIEKHFEINREKQAPAINETSMAMQNYPIARHKKHFHLSREIERGVEGITPEISISIDQQGRYLPRTGGTNRINIVPFTREFLNALQSDATYYGMSEALQDARTLLSNRKYRQKMKAAGQGLALKEMTTMIRRIQGLSSERMMIELMAAKGLSNIGKSILSLRISGGGVQICSVPAAWEIVGPKYFAGNVPTTPQRIERLKDLSPLLWLRWEARQFDFVMGAVHAQNAFRTLLLESTPITDKLLKHYTWGDMVAIDQINQAAQRKIAAETNLKRGTKEFDQKAIELTELATRKTQPVWDMLGRSPLTSSPNVILRGSLMFMSARNAQYQVGIRAIDDMRKGRIGKGEGAKRLAGIGTANMLISVWRRLFKTLMKFGIAGLLVFLGKKPKEELGPTLKEEAIKEVKKIPFEVPMNIIGLAAFGAIFTNIAYRSIARIKYGKYPRPIGETRTGNVFADIMLDVYQLSDHLVDTVQHKITGEKFKSGPDKGKLKWQRSALKASDILAELIAYRFGLPYSGPKGDIIWPAKAVTKKETGESARRKARIEREKRMLK